MKTTRAILLVASLAMLAQITPVAPAGQRLQAAKSVVVRGDVVSVADLLPEDAAAPLRAQAAGVLLGDSPAPGTRRTFRNAELESALRGAPELRAALEIPDAIEVTRWSRPLSPTEILDALSAAINADELSGAGPLTQADLGAIPAVLVTEDAPKIEITRIEPGRSGVEMRMRLWIPSEPRVSPFWISVHRMLIANPELAKGAAAAGSPRKGRSGGSTAAGKNSVAAADAAASAASAVLVRSGERVQLVMLSSGMRITTSATALERGRQGQQIRVRSVLGSKLLVATVVSAQLVEVRY
jgi:Chaperone for flagella basal body P-ring formation